MTTHRDQFPEPPFLKPASLEEEGIALFRLVASLRQRGAGVLAGELRSFLASVSRAAPSPEEAQRFFLTTIAGPAVRSIASEGNKDGAAFLIDAIAGTTLPSTDQPLGASPQGATVLQELREFTASRDSAVSVFPAPTSKTPTRKRRPRPACVPRQPT